MNNTSPNTTRRIKNNPARNILNIDQLSSSFVVESVSESESLWVENKKVFVLVFVLVLELDELVPPTIPSFTPGESKCVCCGKVAGAVGLVLLVVAGATVLGATTIGFTVDNFLGGRE